MTKVLLAAYGCSPIRGSEENNGWSWAIGLARKGYEVWCVTNCQDIEEKEAERLRLGLANLQFVFISLPWKFEKLLFDPTSKKIYFHYYLWKKKASAAVLELHKEQNFDVAQHVSYGSFQQGSCVQKLDNCNIIFGPVGGGQMALPFFKRYFNSEWWQEKIRGFISKSLVNYSSDLREMLKKANTILLINEETKELLIKTFNYKGEIDMVLDAALPLQYEGMKYIEKPISKEFNILWIGRLLRRKGINLSLKALSYLPKDTPYKLTIVGTGQDEQYIDDWIQEFGLDPAKIVRKGSIPFSEVSEEYKKTDALLFCSLRDTAGNQVIEAMGHGVPVIVLNISGMVTMVPENCGVKVTPTTAEGTAKAIAKAIEKLCYDIDFRRKAGRAAYEHAGKLTWQNKIDYVTSKYY